MSDKSFWRDKVTLWHREMVGLDPTTRLPLFKQTKLLDQEPCDLTYVTRVTGEQNASGTIYNMVKKPQIKLMPDEGEFALPSENDQIEVNNIVFQVTTISSFYDAADGRYLGSKAMLEAVEPTDQRRTPDDVTY